MDLVERASSKWSSCKGRRMGRDCEVKERWSRYGRPFHSSLYDALSVLQGITVMYMPGISPQLGAQHASKTGALTPLENTGFLTLQSASRQIFGMPWLEASNGQV